jgi:hypothetical protein
MADHLRETNISFRRLANGTLVCVASFSILQQEWCHVLLAKPQVVQLELAKARPSPWVPAKNPAHGRVWVLVSKPMGGFCF